ncbi:outer membrane protein assembly factor BamC [Ferrimonas pelagia]|uniref:Outer membrane protein assembly factor BamC n=1 Tax=Ferrimonas pelagia TaxID=1177826 RepID=A0ABP9EIY7_9GAMM
MKRSLVALTVVALAGCTTPLERRQASGGFDYLNEAAGIDLVVPAHLKTPRYSTEFEIPQISDEVDADVVGQRLDVRPPLQVLPLADGTRLQDGVDSITILIESNEDEVDLANEIQQTLTQFLAEREIAVASEDAGVIQTEWIESNEVIGRSWWREKVYQVRQRYQFDTAVKDHGRTGSITIELIDHEEGLDGIDDSVVLTDADRRRYAIDMLNSAVAYMNFERQKRRHLAELRDGRGFKAELGFDSSDNTAIVADGKFDAVWSRMGKVLPALGFTVRDYDKNLATYFVEYDGATGFWSSLWGGEDGLAIDDGSYQILLDKMGERTAIVLLDSDAKPLDTATMTALYNDFADVLRKEARQL